MHLEERLERELGPVAAPASLWAGIQEAKRQPRGRSVWTLAACALIMASGAFVWRVVDIHAPGVRAVNAGAGCLLCHSSLPPGV